MTRKRVVITGMGTVNPLAHGVEETWAALLAARSGITATELFDASTFPSSFSAQVKDYDLASHVAESVVWTVPFYQDIILQSDV